MARRMTLIPEELVSSYHLQKPEIRLEEDIENLLEKTKLADDMKAKLLGQLITRYQRTVHTPPEPIPVTVTDGASPAEKKAAEKINMDHEGENTSEIVLKDIMSSAPVYYSKFVPMIVEKLKSRQYGWNAAGEMTQDRKPIHGSNIVDFFSYTLRNAKTLEPPKHYEYFLKAIKEIKIPKTWIANKKVLKRIDTPIKSESRVKKEDSEYVNKIHPVKRKRYKGQRSSDLVSDIEWGGEDESDLIGSKRSSRDKHLFAYDNKRGRASLPEAWLEY